MDGWCEVLLGGQTPILSLNSVKALKDKNNLTMQKNTIYNKNILTETNGLQQI